MFLIHGRPSSSGGGRGGGSCCRVVPVAPAAEPRHMLSNEEPDNFEGLAVAAEVIALGKKNTSPPSTTPPPFWIAM